MRIIEKYNDLLSQVYDEASKKDWKPPIEYLKAIKKYIKSDLHVLDLGIGTGQTAEPFLKVGSKVYGVDISSKMIEITKKKYQGLKITKLDLEKSWSTIDKYKFDIISAIGVLEFINNLPRIFKKVRKILDLQGKFCFTFEEYLQDNKIQRFRVSEIGRINQKDKIPLIFRAKIYRYTYKEIEKMLSKNGFTIISKKQFIAYHRKNIPVYYRIVLAERKGR